MGRYATSTSISLLMPGWLSGNTTTSDTYGADIWSAAADRAEGEVNAALAARYDPSTWTSTGSPAIPPMVRKLSEDLACLYTFRSAQVQDSQIRNPNLPEWEKAEDRLEEIVAGTRKLAYTDGSLVPTRSSSRFLTSTDYAPTFDMDSERSWAVDSNRIDDIEAGRP